MCKAMPFVFGMLTPQRTNFIVGVSIIIGAIGGVYLLQRGARYVCQITEKKVKKKPEDICNVCFSKLEVEDFKSCVSCCNCQKFVCRGRQCSIWLPSQAGWECQLCSLSCESRSRASEWLHQQINEKYLRPMSSRSNPSIPIRDNEFDVHSDAPSSYCSEQREKVREYVEETLASMLGGSLDNVSVGQMFRSREYLPLYENEECPGVSHVKLKRLIEKIVKETLRLPTSLDYSGVSGRPEENLPFFDPKKYQELLATAVLNKIVDSYNYEKKFETENNEDLDKNHNPITANKRKILQQSSSSIEPGSDSSLADATIHIRRDVDAYTSDTDSNFQSDLITGSVHTGDESVLSDYISKHKVPLPELSLDTESPDDDIMSVVTSKSEGNWEDNWLFKKKKRGNETPVSVGMLVPSPREDVKTLIGDKTADEISDLSEGSDFEDIEDVDSKTPNDTDLPNVLIQNKNVIGGKSTVGLFDELLEQTSLISTTSVPEGEAIFNECKNDFILTNDGLDDVQPAPKLDLTNNHHQVIVESEAVNSNVTDFLTNGTACHQEHAIEDVPLFAPPQDFDDADQPSLEQASNSISECEAVTVEKIELPDESTSNMDSLSQAQKIDNAEDASNTNQNTNSNTNTNPEVKEVTQSNLEIPVEETEDLDNSENLSTKIITEVIEEASSVKLLAALVLTPLIAPITTGDCQESQLPESLLHPSHPSGHPTEEQNEEIVLISMSTNDSQEHQTVEKVAVKKVTFAANTQTTPYLTPERKREMLSKIGKSSESEVWEDAMEELPSLETSEEPSCDDLIKHLLLLAPPGFEDEESKSSVATTTNLTDLTVISTPQEDTEVLEVPTENYKLNEIKDEGSPKSDIETATEDRTDITNEEPTEAKTEARGENIFVETTLVKADPTSTKPVPEAASQHEEREENIVQRESHTEADKQGGKDVAIENTAQSPATTETSKQIEGNFSEERATSGEEQQVISEEKERGKQQDVTYQTPAEESQTISTETSSNSHHQEELLSACTDEIKSENDGGSNSKSNESQRIVDNSENEECPDSSRDEQFTNIAPKISTDSPSPDNDAAIVETSPNSHHQEELLSACSDENKPEDVGGSNSKSNDSQRIVDNLESGETPHSSRDKQFTDIAPKISKDSPSPNDDAAVVDNTTELSENQILKADIKVDIETGLSTVLQATITESSEVGEEASRLEFQNDSKDAGPTASEVQSSPVESTPTRQGSIDVLKSESSESTEIEAIEDSTTPAQIDEIVLPPQEFQALGIDEDEPSATRSGIVPDNASDSQCSNAGGGATKSEEIPETKERSSEVEQEREVKTEEKSEREAKGKVEEERDEPIELEKNKTVTTDVEHEIIPNENNAVEKIPPADPADNAVVSNEEAVTTNGSTLSHEDEKNSSSENNKESSSDSSLKENVKIAETVREALSPVAELSTETLPSETAVVETAEITALDSFDIPPPPDFSNEDVAEKSLDKEKGNSTASESGSAVQETETTDKAAAETPSFSVDATVINLKEENERTGLNDVSEKASPGEDASNVRSNADEESKTASEGSSAVQEIETPGESSLEEERIMPSTEVTRSAEEATIANISEEVAAAEDSSTIRSNAEEESSIVSKDSSEALQTEPANNSSLEEGAAKRSVEADSLAKEATGPKPEEESDSSGVINDVSEGAIDEESSEIVSNHGMSADENIETGPPKDTELTTTSSAVEVPSNEASEDTQIENLVKPGSEGSSESCFTDISAIAEASATESREGIRTEANIETESCSHTNGNTEAVTGHKTGDIKKEAASVEEEVASLEKEAAFLEKEAAIGDKAEEVESLIKEIPTTEEVNPEIIDLSDQLIAEESSGEKDSPEEAKTNLSSLKISDEQQSCETESLSPSPEPSSVRPLLIVQESVDLDPVSVLIVEPPPEFKTDLLTTQSEENINEVEDEKMERVEVKDGVSPLEIAKPGDSQVALESKEGELASEVAVQINSQLLSDVKEDIVSSEAAVQIDNPVAPAVEGDLRSAEVAVEIDSHVASENKETLFPSEEAVQMDNLVASAVKGDLPSAEEAVGEDSQVPSEVEQNVLPFEDMQIDNRVASAVKEDLPSAEVAVDVDSRVALEVKETVVPSKEAVQMENPAASAAKVDMSSAEVAVGEESQVASEVKETVISSEESVQMDNPVASAVKEEMPPAEVAVGGESQVASEVKETVISSEESVQMDNPVASAVKEEMPPAEVAVGEESQVASEVKETVISSEESVQMDNPVASAVKEEMTPAKVAVGEDSQVASEVNETVIPSEEGVQMDHPVISSVKEKMPPAEVAVGEESQVASEGLQMDNPVASAIKEDPPSPKVAVEVGSCVASEVKETVVPSKEAVQMENPVASTVKGDLPSAEVAVGEDSQVASEVKETVLPSEEGIQMDNPVASTVKGDLPSAEVALEEDTQVASEAKETVLPSDGGSFIPLIEKTSSGVETEIQTTDSSTSTSGSAEEGVAAPNVRDQNKIEISAIAETGSCETATMLEVKELHGSEVNSLDVEHSGVEKEEENTTENVDEPLQADSNTATLENAPISTELDVQESTERQEEHVDLAEEKAGLLETPINVEVAIEKEKSGEAIPVRPISPPILEPSKALEKLSTLVSCGEARQLEDLKEHGSLSQSERYPLELKTTTEDTKNIPSEIEAIIVEEEEKASEAPISAQNNNEEREQPLKQITEQDESNSKIVSVINSEENPSKTEGIYLAVTEGSSPVVEDLTEVKIKSTIEAHSSLLTNKNSTAGTELSVEARESEEQTPKTESTDSGQRETAKWTTEDDGSSTPGDLGSENPAREMSETENAEIKAPEPVQVDTITSEIQEGERIISQDQKPPSTELPNAAESGEAVFSDPTRAVSPATFIRNVLGEITVDIDMSSSPMDSLVLYPPPENLCSSPLSSPLLVPAPPSDEPLEENFSEAAETAKGADLQSDSLLDAEEGDKCNASIEEICGEQEKVEKESEPKSTGESSTDAIVAYKSEAESQEAASETNESEGAATFSQKQFPENSESESTENSNVAVRDRNVSENVNENVPDLAKDAPENMTVSVDTVAKQSPAVEDSEAVVQETSTCEIQSTESTETSNASERDKNVSENVNENDPDLAKDAPENMILSVDTVEKQSPAVEASEAMVQETSECEIQSTESTEISNTSETERNVSENVNENVPDLAKDASENMTPSVDTEAKQSPAVEASEAVVQETSKCEIRSADNTETSNASERDRNVSENVNENDPDLAKDAPENIILSVDTVAKQSPVVEASETVVQETSTCEIRSTESTEISNASETERNVSENVNENVPDLAKDAPENVTLSVDTVVKQSPVVEASEAVVQETSECEIRSNGKQMEIADNCETNGIDTISEPGLEDQPNTKAHETASNCPSEDAASVTTENKEEQSIPILETEVLAKGTVETTTHEAPDSEKRESLKKTEAVERNIDIEKDPVLEAENCEAKETETEVLTENNARGPQEDPVSGENPIVPTKNESTDSAFQVTADNTKNSEAILGTSTIQESSLTEDVKTELTKGADCQTNTAASESEASNQSPATESNGLPIETGQSSSERVPESTTSDTEIACSIPTFDLTRSLSPASLIKEFKNQLTLNIEACSSPLDSLVLQPPPSCSSPLSSLLVVPPPPDMDSLSTAKIREEREETSNDAESVSTTSTLDQLNTGNDTKKEDPTNVTATTEFVQTLTTDRSIDGPKKPTHNFETKMPNSDTAQNHISENHVVVVPLSSSVTENKDIIKKNNEVSPIDFSGSSFEYVGNSEKIAEPIDGAGESKTGSSGDTSSSGNSPDDASNNDSPEQDPNSGENGSNGSDRQSGDGGGDEPNDNKKSKEPEKKENDEEVTDESSEDAMDHLTIEELKAIEERRFSYSSVDETNFEFGRELRESSVPSNYGDTDKEVIVNDTAPATSEKEMDYQQPSPEISDETRKVSEDVEEHSARPDETPTNEKQDLVQDLKEMTVLNQSSEDTSSSKGEKTGLVSDTEVAATSEENASNLKEQLISSEEREKNVGPDNIENPDLGIHSDEEAKPPESAENAEVSKSENRSATEELSTQLEETNEAFQPETAPEMFEENSKDQNESQESSAENAVKSIVRPCRIERSTSFKFALQRPSEDAEDDQVVEISISYIHKNRNGELSDTSGCGENLVGERSYPKLEGTELTEAVKRQEAVNDEELQREKIGQEESATQEPDEIEPTQFADESQNQEESKRAIAIATAQKKTLPDPIIEEFEPGGKGEANKEEATTGAQSGTPEKSLECKVIEGEPVSALDQKELEEPIHSQSTEDQGEILADPAFVHSKAGNEEEANMECSLSDADKPISQEVELTPAQNEAAQSANEEAAKPVQKDITESKEIGEEPRINQKESKGPIQSVPDDKIVEPVETAQTETLADPAFEPAETVAERDANECEPSGTTSATGTEVRQHELKRESDIINEPSKPEKEIDESTNMETLQISAENRKDVTGETAQEETLADPAFEPTKAGDSAGAEKEANKCEPSGPGSGELATKEEKKGVFEAATSLSQNELKRNTDVMDESSKASEEIIERANTETVQISVEDKKSEAKEEGDQYRTEKTAEENYQSGENQALENEKENVTQGEAREVNEVAANELKDEEAANFVEMGPIITIEPPSELNQNELNIGQKDIPDTAKIAESSVKEQRQLQQEASSPAESGLTNSNADLADTIPSVVKAVLKEDENQQAATRPAEAINSGPVESVIAKEIAPGTDQCEVASPPKDVVAVGDPQENVTEPAEVLVKTESELLPCLLEIKEEEAVVGLSESENIVTANPAQMEIENHVEDENGEALSTIKENIPSNTDVPSQEADKLTVEEISKTDPNEPEENAREKLSQNEPSKESMSPSEDKRKDEQEPTEPDTVNEEKTLELHDILEGPEDPSIEEMAEVLRNETTKEAPLPMQIEEKSTTESPSVISRDESPKDLSSPSESRSSDQQKPTDVDEKENEVTPELQTVTIDEFSPSLKEKLTTGETSDIPPNVSPKEASLLVDNEAEVIIDNSSLESMAEKNTEALSKDSLENESPTLQKTELPAVDVRFESPEEVSSQTEATLKDEEKTTGPAIKKEENTSDLPILPTNEPRRGANENLCPVEFAKPHPSEALEEAALPAESPRDGQERTEPEIISGNDSSLKPLESPKEVLSPTEIRLGEESKKAELEKQATDELSSNTERQPVIVDTFENLQHQSLKEPTSTINNKLEIISESIFPKLEDIPPPELFAEQKSETLKNESPTESGLEEEQNLIEAVEDRIPQEASEICCRDSPVEVSPAIDSKVREKLAALEIVCEEKVSAKAVEEAHLLPIKQTSQEKEKLGSTSETSVLDLPAIKTAKVAESRCPNEILAELASENEAVERVTKGGRLVEPSPQEEESNIGLISETSIQDLPTVKVAQVSESSSPNKKPAGLAIEIEEKNSTVTVQQATKDERLVTPSLHERENQVCSSSGLLFQGSPGIKTSEVSHSWPPNEVSSLIKKFQRQSESKTSLEERFQTEAEAIPLEFEKVVRVPEIKSPSMRMSRDDARPSLDLADGSTARPAVDLPVIIPKTESTEPLESSTDPAAADEDIEDQKHKEISTNLPSEETTQTLSTTVASAQPNSSLTNQTNNSETNDTNTLQRHIKLEALKNSSFSQPLGAEENPEDTLGHLLPGSIAERERLKWYQAVEMPNNPYAPEALKHRLSIGSEKPMDIPNKNISLDLTASQDQSTNLDEDSDGSSKLQIVLGADKPDQKRYGRDYYINDAKYACGTNPRSEILKESRLSLSLNEDDQQQDNKVKQCDTEPTVTSSKPSVQRSSSCSEKRVLESCDLFTARPVRVEESDPILNKAIKLEYLSTPERDFYLLPSEEVEISKSSNQSETSSQISQNLDSLTASEDSDTIRVYDLKNQETRILKDEKVRESPDTADSKKPQPNILSFTPKTGTFQLPKKITTPTSLKFLQPKRKPFDPRRIMSVDSEVKSPIFDNNNTMSASVDCQDKMVIEEEIISALPSVKALAKAFSVTSPDTTPIVPSYKTKIRYHNRTTSYNSLDVKTQHIPEGDHEETQGNQPSSDSYSPPYNRTYNPVEPDHTTEETNNVLETVVEQTNSSIEFAETDHHDQHEEPQEEDHTEDHSHHHEIELVVKLQKQDSFERQERPISPVLVPGLLKNNIAFFENLKNK